MTAPKRLFDVAVLALMLSACTHPNVARLDAAEPLLADYLDAAGAVDLLDSGARPEFDGASLEIWRARYAERETTLRTAIAAIDGEQLAANDQRRLLSMQSALALRSETGADAGEPGCADAQSLAISGPALRAALYACYGEAAEAIAYEGETIGRIGALGLLETLGEERDRRAVFDAMTPLYRAANGDGGAQSPYRRMIMLERARMTANIAGSVQSLGLTPDQGEAWLVRALEGWERTLPYRQAEPWDFRLAMLGPADGEFASCASRDVQIEGNARFYGDLGADLEALGVIIHASGDEPVAYADFARVGRDVDGVWRAAAPWTTLNVIDGGPDAAAELVHEVGHTVHYAAMRARPSLIFPDDLSLVLEALADVPAWSVFEPAWQAKYVGCAIQGDTALRAKLTPIMLDMAWGLFEIRMARAPESDPNVVWGEIMERYFRVRRHDDLSWWAVRGQLVEEPGYMVNYALGAFVTADVRARVRDEVGGFDSGNPRWYGYVSENLFERGGEDPPRVLLRSFLGRDVTPDALLEDLDRLRQD